VQPDHDSMLRYLIGANFAELRHYEVQSAPSARS
jgi:hypothetical protein